jgi:3-phosphoshikimate 1-carboxyvinyltransferase
VSSPVYLGVIVSGAKIADGIKKLLWLAKSLQSYIKMTLALLNDLDIKTSFEGNVITVYQNK